MIRQRRAILALFLAAAFVGRFAVADAYDPPAGYYSTATGTGATLKGQLHNIITTGDSYRSYDQLRTDLQITDADLVDPSKLRVVYNNGVAITKVTSGNSGIPGWDDGNTWNREHSWPQNRGVDSTSAPDGSDLFHLFSSKMTDNSTRGDLNFGGVFGAQTRGIVSDGGTKYYPGDADAGLIARAEFYVAVRYDGSESGTADLELAAGDPNPGSTSVTLGDLNRLLEWHFAKVPDTYERKRNDLIYDNYQNNRNPFIDRPEFVWSIFMNQTNDSQITIASPTTVNATTGASTKTVNLTNVIVGGSVPAAQSVTVNKGGSNGTYYSVTAAGTATSTISGPNNAFRTNQTDSKSITVGLNTTTSSAGLKTGTVTIDNLDITPGSNGGLGHAANDANDVITINLNVLDHATPRFVANQATSLTLDFGNIALGSSVSPLNFGLTNLTSLVGFTAGLDLDSITPAGNTAAFTTNLAPFSSLAAGSSNGFTSSFIAASVGTFTASYTLGLSDENLSGALNTAPLTLTLTGKVRLAGDYNVDGVVDSGDYLVWRRTSGQTGVTAYTSADGDGNSIINEADFDVWRTHFGQTAAGAGGGLSTAAVPEPATIVIFAVAISVCGLHRRRVTAQQIHVSEASLTPIGRHS